MAEIEVEGSRQTPEGFSFRVTVGETASESQHEVSLSKGDYERLRRGSEQPEQFLRRCFEFLLAREPKESILSRFDVADISRYFPEFEQRIAT